MKIPLPEFLCTNIIIHRRSRAQKLVLRGLFAFAALVLASTAHSQAPYAGNGLFGFGGEIGQGSLTLSNNETTLTGTIVTNGNPFDNYLVIYIDSQTGGFTSTENFTDAGDSHRKAISGYDGSNRSTLTFAPTFEADYAIALNPDFGGLWDVNTNASHTFLSSVNFTSTGTNTYTFTVSLASLGVSAGSTFDFSSTYISNTAYRSNEAYNAIAGNPADAGGNFGRNPSTASFNTYAVTPVPEPATMATALLVVGALVWHQRRALGSLWNRARRHAA